MINEMGLVIAWNAKILFVKFNNFPGLGGRQGQTLPPLGRFAPSHCRIYLLFSFKCWQVCFSDIHTHVPERYCCPSIENKVLGLKAKIVKCWYVDAIVAYPWDGLELEGGHLHAIPLVGPNGSIPRDVWYGSVNTKVYIEIKFTITIKITKSYNWF